MVEAIFMKGTLSDGYTPIGPYASWADAAEAHECEDGWIMALIPPEQLGKKRRGFYASDPDDDPDPFDAREDREGT